MQYNKTIKNNDNNDFISFINNIEDSVELFGHMFNIVNFFSVIDNNDALMKQNKNTQETTINNSKACATSKPDILYFVNETMMKWLLLNLCENLGNDIELMNVSECGDSWHGFMFRLMFQIDTILKKMHLYLILFIGH